VTNLRPEKGIGDLVKAAALVRERYRDARFLIWGEGPLRTHLEGLVRTLRLDRVVEFRGATAAPEVALRELDIFVLPSLSEACSNALLEAMAAELPVVATHVGGNPLLVEDEISGLLVPPSDPAALAKAIIRLMEEPALAAELAARGRHRVLGQFTFERMLTRVEALYDQALAERGG
jgi:glycosyltransferase involved in cell wall biosynthesis